MTFQTRRVLLAAVGGFVLTVGSTGCALRATTDFGPQSPSSTRSLSAGPEGLPGGVSGVSGPGGDSIGLRARDGDGPSASDAGAGVDTGAGR